MNQQTYKMDVDVRVDIDAENCVRIEPDGCFNRLVVTYNSVEPLI